MPSETKFVLKTYYTESGKKCFENEIYAFKSLLASRNPVSNLIKFYGSWKQGNRLNILLEYADGTLLDYFRTIRPPTREEDISKFWGKFLCILKPMERIHELRNPHNPFVLHGYV